MTESIRARPKCYDRPSFKDTILVPYGRLAQYNSTLHARETTPLLKYIPDPMSKGCKQHGPMGEATLHPEDWNCEGCKWRPA